MEEEEWRELGRGGVRGAVGSSFNYCRVFFLVEHLHPWMLEVLFNKPLQAPRRLCETSVHAGDMEGLKE